MNCPKCGVEDNAVTKTINLEDFVKRYRKCLNCFENFVTYEIVREDVATAANMFKKFDTLNKKEY